MPGSAQVFPEVAFFFVITQPEVVEFAAGNEPHDPVILHQRQVPKAAIPHQAQRVDCGLIGR